MIEDFRNFMSRPVDAATGKPVARQTTAGPGTTVQLPTVAGVPSTPAAVGDNIEAAARRAPIGSMLHSAAESLKKLPVATFLTGKSAQEIGDTFKAKYNAIPHIRENFKGWLAGTLGIGARGLGLVVGSALAFSARVVALPLMVLGGAASTVYGLARENERAEIRQQPDSQDAFKDLAERGMGWGCGIAAVLMIGATMVTNLALGEKNESIQHTHQQASHRLKAEMGKLGQGLAQFGGAVVLLGTTGWALDQVMGNTGKLTQNPGTSGTVAPPPPSTEQPIVLPRTDPTGGWV